MSFLDFPGCITAGKTLEEARRRAAEALALHIEGMVEDGQEIPEPSSLDAVAANPAMQALWRLWSARNRRRKKRCV